VSNAENKRSKLRYVRAKDYFACIVFLIMVPIALIAKIFIHNFWLVGEERNEARDNGYWFFKYVRENHPKQKIAYVINKKCGDYEKVKHLGKVIQWGGISHWFWYLTAKKNISSQKGCKPNAAACYLFEVKLRLWRNKRFFLQHGITINDGKWLYNDVCRFKLFVCGAKPEYEFVKDKFGYPEQAVRYLGFCRFDNLFDYERNSKQILIMPTWRSYLVRAHNNVSDRDLYDDFINTEYYKKWAELLCCRELHEKLIENNLTVLFYPHRNMQRIIEHFNSLDLPDCVTIADVKDVDVQKALKESACLITDYSSVFFDFSYMKKPVIFYQFDESEFRANQYGEGYFDYHHNPLGKWSDNFTDCLQLINEAIDNRFSENDKVNDFFELYDKDNCKRNFEAVCEI